jgi:hypothetical protein
MHYFYLAYMTIDTIVQIYSELWVFTYYRDCCSAVNGSNYEQICLPEVTFNNILTVFIVHGFNRIYIQYAVVTTVTIYSCTCYVRPVYFNTTCLLNQLYRTCKFILNHYSGVNNPMI